MAIPMSSFACLAAVVASLRFSAAIRFLGRKEGSAGQQCAALKNRGAYFGVDVGIGTPPQVFNLVADTGSNNLVAVSCVCKEQGGCSGAEHCFRGTNKSSSFVIDEEPPEMSVTFGSGSIWTVIVTENVTVANVSAYMPNHVMLLVSDAWLFISGPFEGILGLGVPGAAEAAGALAENGTDYSKSFLEDAGVSSFTMCFSDDNDGALRMNPELRDTMKSVGTSHWGLGMHGIAVGGAGAAGEGTMLLSCSSEDPSAGYATPCGMIPDSGTTLIMGPPAQVMELYGVLCEEWPLCNRALQDILVGDDRDVEWTDVKDLLPKADPHSMWNEERMVAIDPEARNATGNSTAASNATDPAEEGAEKAAADMYATVVLRQKARLFLYLVDRCADWMQSPQDLGNLPSLYLNVSDSDNKTRVLELTPYSYILQAVEVNVSGTGEDRTRCGVAIDVMDYATNANGPVWIAGSPLFYEYEVGYNLPQKSMSFTKLADTPAGCQPCDVDSANETSQSLISLRNQRQRQLRRLDGTPLKPSIDTTKPL